MKKLLVILLTMVLFLSGCKAFYNIDQYLAKGDYNFAYELAYNDELKNDVVMENFIAYCYQDVYFADIGDFYLSDGYFGRVSAYESDTYVANNDPYFDLDTYTELADWIWVATGNHPLYNYYYCLLKTYVGENRLVPVYFLYGYNTTTGEIILPGYWYSLDFDNDDDDNNEALAKYIARQLSERGQGIHASEEEIERVRNLVSNNTTPDIKFQFDLE